MGKLSQAPVPEPGSLGRIWRQERLHHPRLDASIFLCGGRGEEGSACRLGWNDWPPNIIPFHFHVPAMAHVKPNSFHAS